MTDSAQEPILASTLYLASKQSDPISRLATGLPGLDGALGGGFVYGSLSCISAASQDSASRELVLQILVEHLLATAGLDSDARIIDTTLSFDVRDFHQRVTATLKARGEADVDAQAMKVLQRLRIMKAFDFVGLVECVTELSEDLKREAQAPAATEKWPKGTIEDSQDEGTDIVIDEHTPSLARAFSPPKSSRFSNGRKLLLIDNITQAVLTQFKIDHIQGQSVLSSLMRTLHHLTVTYNLATLLTNHTTSDSQKIREETPSIFTSCTSRPALGKSFAGALDFHLLIHDIPKAEANAREVYADRRSHGECVSVIEVLQDRSNGNVGRWISVETQVDRTLREIS